MPSIFENGGLIGKINNYTTGYETLEFVGGRTAGTAGTTSNQLFSLTTITGGIASAPREGDIVIVVLSIASTADRSYRISGYTQIADIYVNDDEDINLQVGYKIMGATPDTTFTITGGSGSAFDGLSVAVHVWANIDPDNPIDVTSTQATAVDTANPNPASITPVTPGAQILVAGGSATNLNTVYNTPGYLSNFYTSVGLDTNDATVGLGNIAWSGGAYDPAAWTITGADSINFSTAAVTMALRPKVKQLLISKGMINLNAVYNGLQ